MKTPENDLFEVSIQLASGQRRILVRVIDQRKTQFRVQLDGLPVDIDDEHHHDLILLGPDFPAHFEAKSLGNLMTYMDRHAGHVGPALSTGGIHLGTLMLARVVTLMAQTGVGAAQAIEESIALGNEIRAWHKSVIDTAGQTRIERAYAMTQ